MVREMDAVSDKTPSDKPSSDTSSGAVAGSADAKPAPAPAAPAAPPPAADKPAGGPVPSAPAASAKAESAKAPAPAKAESPKPEGKPAAAAKAAPAKAASKVKQPLGGTRLRSALIRLSFGLAGVGLFSGFFLPWVGLEGVVSVTGFSLMASEGQVVTLLSGPSRMILLAVPMLGVALMVGAMTGHRSSLWVGLLTGLLVVGYGLVTLIRLFVRTTGLGLWLVVGCAFLSLVVALLGLGRRSRG